MKSGESFIGQPVRSLQTMLRTIHQDDPSSPSVVPDGIYGQTTMYAVTEFQRRNGLPITGITDQTTWDAIAAVYETALIRVGKAESIEISLDPGQVFQGGDESPYIALAQSMLIWLAREHTQIDMPNHSGSYDNSTAIAVRQFQLLAGLPETGLLDRVTWLHLARHFALNAHHTGKRNIILAPAEDQFLKN